MIYYTKLIALFTLLLVWASIKSLVAATDGTIPNRTYPASEQYLNISPDLGDKHYNQPVFFNGYAIFCGNAEHDIFDISNPYNPRHEQTLTSPYYSDRDGESHQISFSRVGNTFYMLTISGKGIDIWDVTNTTQTTLVSAVDLPNIDYGDVTGGIWGMYWSGNYIYAGATTFGLYVIDVSDVENPVMEKNIPEVDVGGVAPGPLWAVGNLLIVTTPKDHSGLAKLSLNDPANPALLDALDFADSDSYIGGFYGKNAYLLDRLRWWDVLSDPERLIYGGEGERHHGQYFAFANDYFYLGGVGERDKGIRKYALNNLSTRAVVGRFEGRPGKRDEQFVCPIGNIYLVADDEDPDGEFIGGTIVVDTLTPDTRGIQLMDIYPPNGAVNQPTSSTVGLSLNEWPEFKSVGPESFILRPKGAGASGHVSGVYSSSTTVVSFAPDAPLQAGTVYEVVLPQGGITDGVGNGIESTVISEFTTSGNAEPDPNLEDAEIEGELNAELGHAINLNVKNPYSQFDYEWVFSDGAVYQGQNVSHSYANAGRYIVTLKTKEKQESTLKLEAETAVLSGGIIISDTNPGYSGSGFADYPSSTGSDVYLEWSHVHAGGGTVDLLVRYANSNASSRPLRLTVNGQTIVDVLDLPQTGSWTDYSSVTVEDVTLVSGENKISLIADAGSVGPNVDYLGIVTSGSGNVLDTTSKVSLAYHPPTANPPANSKPILRDSQSGRIWTVNQDSQTVSAVNAETGELLLEVFTGKKPTSLAQAANGDIWVVNQMSHSITIHDPTSGVKKSTVPLSIGSEPYGIVFNKSSSTAYVSLEATGSVVEIDGLSQAILKTIILGDNNSHIRYQLRGLTLNAANTKLYALRFVSADQGGEVYEISTADLSLSRVINLGLSTVPDDALGGRGIPNYLVSGSITPDGRNLLLPSKQDNIERGGFRDGLPLNSENTVRAVISKVDLLVGSENLDKRMDVDNSDRVHSIVYSPLGDLIFAAIPGNDEVTVLDFFSGSTLAQISTGSVPHGLLLEGNKLYVLNFLSRSLSVFDVSDILSGGVEHTFEREISLVGKELLSEDELTGKKLFYNSSSAALSKDGYMSCASCHLDGGSDGRVWDISHLGEGLRNTIDLNGKGVGHGFKHWSANFDEVQDFENQIRNLNEGSGLMHQEDYALSESPLGIRKEGRSAQLDALAAYVDSLTQFGESPHRKQDGTLSDSGAAGLLVFNQLNCVQCHSGSEFTDSESGNRHDVGTLTALSGQRLGGDLTSLDTPTLGGLWKSAPYFHDGSAATIEDVFDVGYHDNVTKDLTQLEFDNLISYILQIDDIAMNKLNQTGDPIVSFNGPTDYSVHATGVSLDVDVHAVDTDGDIDFVNLFIDGVELVRRENAAPYRWHGSGSDTEIFNLQPGTYVLTARATDNEGNHSESSIKLTVSNVGMNLVRNPSFESGEAEWVVGSNSTVSIDESLSGTQSLKLTAGASNTRQTIALEQNTDYELSVWVLASGLTSGGVRFDTMDKFDSETGPNGPGGDCQFNINVGDAQTWTKYTGNFNSASETSVTLRTYQAGMEGVVYFDDIKLVSLSSSDPYTAWKGVHSIIDDMADEDNDGLLNFMEYALGGNPRTIDNARKPVVRQDGAVIEFRFHRGEPTVTYTIQKSSDLLNWSDYVTVDDTHGLSGTDALVPVPLSEMAAGKLFLRLKVEN